MSTATPIPKSSPRGSFINVQPAASPLSSPTAVSTSAASSIVSLDKFRQPIGYFRVSEFVLALISVACMADVSGISTYNELTAVIGIGSLCIVYLGLLLPLYGLQPLIASNPTHAAPLTFLHRHLSLLELIVDFCLTAMLLASFLASAIRCGSTYYVQGVSQGIALCDSESGHNVEASIGIEFLLLCFMAASTRLSWRTIMYPAADPSQTEKLLTRAEARV